MSHNDVLLGGDEDAVAEAVEALLVWKPPYRVLVAVADDPLAVVCCVARRALRPVVVGDLSRRLAGVVSPFVGAGSGSGDAVVYAVSVH